MTTNFMRMMVGYCVSAALLAGAVALPFHPGIRIGLALIAVLSAVFGIRAQLNGLRSGYEAKLAEAERLYEQQLLQSMSRMRHDVLNDLQLLFGYIQLKKYDKLQACMENIKAKMQQESYISRLGIPSLIAYFFAVRTEAQELRLEIELEQEMNLSDLPIDSDRIAALTQALIEVFRAAALPREQADSDLEDNVLSLQFALEDDRLLLDFMYRGGYKLIELTASLERLLLTEKSLASLEDKVFNEREAAVTVGLPFPT